MPCAAPHRPTAGGPAFVTPQSGLLAAASASQGPPALRHGRSRPLRPRSRDSFPAVAVVGHRAGRTIASATKDAPGEIGPGHRVATVGRVGFLTHGCDSGGRPEGGEVLRPRGAAARAVALLAIVGGDLVFAVDESEELVRLVSKGQSLPRLGDRAVAPTSAPRGYSSSEDGSSGPVSRRGVDRPRARRITHKGKASF
jgi:hypothetical protein